MSAPDKTIDQNAIDPNDVAVLSASDQECLLRAIEFALSSPAAHPERAERAKRVLHDDPSVMAIETMTTTIAANLLAPAACRR